MNIIIPMAGRGSRLRPHTLTVPKPLIPVGGKPIVHRLVEDIISVCGASVNKIGFVIGDFGEEVEEELLRVSASFGAEGHIFHQNTPLGTGHAVLCAEALLDGPVVIAFADTLFKADFQIKDEEGILWVKKIHDPENFGVVKLNAASEIVEFVEKPQTFVSDLAMIGVYYIRRGEELKSELHYLVENAVIKSGEYQLPDALRRLTQNGTRFKPGEVQEWLDCGNKIATVETNSKVLAFDEEAGKPLVSKSATLINSIVIPPCYIGEFVHIENAVVGPFVSLGEATHVKDSVIKNSLIQKNSTIENVVLNDSMIGSNVHYRKNKLDISIGDYCTHHE